MHRRLRILNGLVLTANHPLARQLVDLVPPCLVGIGVRDIGITLVENTDVLLVWSGRGECELTRSTFDDREGLPADRVISDVGSSTETFT